MDVFFETLKIMVVGMMGVFASIFVFYFMIKSMIRLSEEKS